jgi:hypothetical protein
LLNVLYFKCELFICEYVKLSTDSWMHVCLILQQILSFKRHRRATKRPNITYVSEFHLMGFSEVPELQPILFSLLLSMYLCTVLGTCSSSWLSALTPISTPHVLLPLWSTLHWNLYKHHHDPKDAGEYPSITYTGCLSQVLFVLIFGGLESCPIAVRAHDHYVAICHPVRYTVIMNPFLGTAHSLLLQMLYSTVWRCWGCPFVEIWKFPTCFVNLFTSWRWPVLIPFVITSLYTQLLVYLQRSSLWDYFLIYSNCLLYFEDPNCGEKT